MWPSRLPASQNTMKSAFFTSEKLRFPPFPCVLRQVQALFLSPLPHAAYTFRLTEVLSIKQCYVIYRKVDLRMFW